MKKINARVPYGDGQKFRVQEIELLTVEEAKQVINGRDWDLGFQIYRENNPGEAIGTMIEVGGEEIFVKFGRVEV